MNINERVDLLVRLGEYCMANDEALRAVKQRANAQNPWFSPAFIDLALQNIAQCFLQRGLLEAWMKKYDLPAMLPAPKNTGIVMAGNIPLVGFHDFLCVFISGGKAIIKPSSKDEVLINYLAQKLIEFNKEAAAYIMFAETLKHCDTYIATGSNNSSRYFEYYFSKYPNIIRRNRTSVAIITGNETEEELDLLADDIQLYYGMGCRNVTRLYVPEGYDFIPLLNALKKYNYFADFHKYKNNYDYQLALLIMNHKFYMTNDSLILTEGDSVFAPVSQVNYSFYNEPKTLAESLQRNTDVQCIVGRSFIPFGKAQSPSLTDYADGIDTMQFLKQLN
ncbi:acyl-CoA reductase [Parafilimonas sp.]|uniref:acyl-CoA reductase n=1 Tax=Parafilimonas sp. TaxID=1969739 RepID=UPI0039E44B13